MKKHELDHLVAEAQTGSSQAFSAVYGFYAKDLYRFALYYTGNGADAEDCVQEAVLLAFRKIASLKKISSFQSWMFKILSNVCKGKLLESADRRFPVPIHEIQETEPDRTVTDAGLSAEISDALNRLAPDERQIVLLRVIGRYKSSEIAAMLGLAPGTVRSKLSRSLTKLRNILQ